MTVGQGCFEQHSVACNPAVASCSFLPGLRPDSPGHDHRVGERRHRFGRDDCGRIHRQSRNQYFRRRGMAESAGIVRRVGRLGVPTTGTPEPRGDQSPRAAECFSRQERKTVCGDSGWRRRNAARRIRADGYVSSRCLSMAPATGGLPTRRRLPACLTRCDSREHA